MILYLAIAIPVSLFLIAFFAWLMMEFNNDDKFERWYSAVIKWREEGSVGRQPELEDFGYKR